MPNNTLESLAKRLQGFLLQSFTQQELTEVLFYGMNQLDLNHVASGSNYNHIVFNLITWSLRQQVFLKLAQVTTADRPQNQVGQVLVADIENFQPQAQAGEAHPIPDQLSVLIARYDELEGLPATPERWAQMQFLANSLRSLAVEQYDLCERFAFHLSSVGGERLAAVLHLEKRPLSKYLRWLCERVAVEGPFVGVVAATALTYVALRSPPADMPVVRKAVREASQLLDGVPNATDRKRELYTASEVIERRSANGQAFPLDFNEFLGGVLEAYDRAAFMDLCKTKLQMPLDRIVGANPDTEYMAWAILRTAEQANWVEDLLREAKDGAPADKNKLRDLYKKFQNGGKKR